jgi:hypothetical protein
MRSQGTAIGIEFVDIPLLENQKNSIQFTFLWLDEDRWEGKDYTVNVREQEVAAYSGGNSSRKRKLHRQRAIAG